MKNIKQHIIKLALGTAVVLGGFSSCVDDLNTLPLNENIITTENFYSTSGEYLEVLAKLYGGFSLTGQVGPDGDQDITGVDEGASNYIRAYWYMQDMTTEMALWIWNDDGIPNLQTNQWSSANEISMGMYYRIYYQITLANEFIRQSAESKLSSKGFTESQKEVVRAYRAEARFLRALSYYHALDLYGSVPFVTEDDGVGAYLPEQISKRDLFNYIESELKSLESLMAAPLQNEFARADVAADWLLLAKLYLNAEVYTGSTKYTEAVTYAQKVITSGYELDPNYQKLFMADNNTALGIILPIVHDGINAQSWGGTTMIACSSWSTDMDANAYGISPWGGNRARKQLIDKFEDYTGATDTRAMFYTQDRTATTDEISDFYNGFSVMKYKNITTAGVLGSNNEHMDIDFPLMRVADAYLIAAESVLRGGTGATAEQALDYVNVVRERAYGDVSGDISSSELTLDFILDERAREFYWEGYRRTDLIRYGYFTSADYVWEWKGGVFEGKGLDDKFNHFPIPASDINANPNLEQDGY